MFGGEKRQAPEHRVRAAGKNFRPLVTIGPKAGAEQIDNRTFEPGASVVGGNRDVFEMRIDKKAPRPSAEEGGDRSAAVPESERYHRQGRHSESSPDKEGSIVPVIHPVGPAEWTDNIQHIADALRRENPRAD